MKITGPLFWCQVLWFAECAPDHRFLFLCVWPAQLARLFSCFPNKRMCDSATFLHLVWMQPWVKHFRKKVRGCFCVWALCVMSYLLRHTCGRKKDNYFEHVLPKTTWLLKAKMSTTWHFLSGACYAGRARADDMQPRRKGWGSQSWIWTIVVF